MNAYAIKRLTYLFLVLMITFLLVVPYTASGGIGPKAFVTLDMGALMFFAFAGLFVRNLEKFIDLENIVGMKQDWKDRFKLFIIYIMVAGFLFALAGCIALLALSQPSTRMLMGITICLLSLGAWGVLVVYTISGHRVDVITYWSPYVVNVLGVLMALQQL